MSCSRVLFDTPQEDPDYAPLPEDQSGTSWNGQGVEDADQGQNDEDLQGEENWKFQHHKDNNKPGDAFKVLLVLVGEVYHVKFWQCNGRYSLIRGLV